MALEIVRNISVDFYDKKYIMINAKQYDSSSRLISVTCYNQGEFFNLSSKKHSAYIKYRKADGHGVLNACKINYKGDVLVELTEQMLAADGICYVDLIIINKGSAMVNIDTGEIITIDDSPILSTMAFCVNVYETSIDNSEFESSYEYDGLNDLLKRAEADYTEVVMLSKSYAVGNANDIRENENFDNSKYYYEQSLINATNAKISEDNAKESEINSKESETNSKTSETNAKISETNAKVSEINAEESETNAKTSEVNAKESEMNAIGSETSAKESEINAKESEDNAADSETNAKTSETNALNSATIAKSYTVGGTGTRENEDKDNVQYYYGLVKSIVDGLNSGFIPIGTITFEELATAEKATGYTYNISNDFITTDDFAEGAGKPYAAGVNVFCRSDGLWDCFGGSTPPMATVDEVKSYLGI